MIILIIIKQWILAIWYTAKANVTWKTLGALLFLFSIQVFVNAYEAEANKTITYSFGMLCNIMGCRLVLVRDKKD